MGTLSPEERLVNLALKLANARKPLSAQEILFDPTIGYDSTADPASFERMFSRDKEALRESGLIITVHPDHTYSLDKEATYAAEVDLEPTEIATLRALGLALLDDDSFPLRDDLRFALSKIALNLAVPLSEEEELSLLDKALEEDDWGDSQDDKTAPTKQSGRASASRSGTSASAVSSVPAASSAPAGSPTHVESSRSAGSPTPAGSPASSTPPARGQQIYWLKSAAQVVEPGIIAPLKTALELCKTVTFAYTNSRGAQSQRTVHPYGLFSMRDCWYLVAYDCSRKEIRVFRHDRMNDVSYNTKKPAQPDYEIPEINLADYQGFPFQYGDDQFEAVFAAAASDRWRLERMARGKGVIAGASPEVSAQFLELTGQSAQDDDLDNTCVTWTIPAQNVASAARFAASAEFLCVPVAPPAVVEAYTQGRAHVKQLHKQSLNTAQGALLDMPTASQQASNKPLSHADSAPHMDMHNQHSQPTSAEVK